MRKGLLLSEPMNAIRKMRKNALVKRLFFIGALLFCLPFMGRAQSAPGFLGGAVQSRTFCINSTANEISSMFTIIDPDAGDLETWSVFMAPSNGSMGGFPATAVSTGSILTIGPGLTYTPNPGFSGLDSFTIKVDDGTGLSDFTTVYVTINPPPAVDPISGPNSVCVGGTITLTDITPGGTWSSTNGITTVFGGIVVAGASPGVDTINYAVTDVCGTTTTVTYEVTVTLTPVVAPIFGPTELCPGSTITLFDGTSGGTWTASNGFATVSGTGDVTGVTPGVDTIYYAVTLACGTTTVSYTVTVDALPTVGPLSGPSSVCVASSITLTDPTPGGFWNRQNTTASVNSSGLVTGVTAGVDTIYYTIINICGSINASKIVTVNPLPAPGFITGTYTEVCVGATINVSDASPGGLWSMTNARATITSGGLITGGFAGLDTVKYSVTNGCGTAIAIYPITINPLPDAGTITGLTSVCVADTITLTDATAGGTGTWSIRNANATINTTGDVIGVTAGLDTAVYTYTNVCGTAFTTYPVTVNPLPFAGAITGRTRVCALDTIHLGNTVTGGVWSTIATTAGVGSSSGIVTGISAGVARITFTYTNMCGSVFVTHLDTVVALPDSGHINGATSLCAGTNITLTDASPGGIWSSSNANASVTSGGTVAGVSGGVVVISYSVTNECRTAVATHQVTVNTIPSPGVITGDTAICVDDLVHLHNIVQGGIWTLSNTNALIDDSGVVSGVVPGTRDTITYTVTNACGTTSTTFTVKILDLAICWHTYVPPVTGFAASVNMYPNPATDELVIKIEDGAFKTYTITNQLGQLIMQSSLTGAQTTVNISSLAPGLYNISLNGAGGVVNRKLIKE
jgi:hypothetical protein